MLDSGGDTVELHGVGMLSLLSVSMLTCAQETMRGKRRTCMRSRGMPKLEGSGRGC